MLSRNVDAWAIRLGRAFSLVGKAHASRPVLLSSRNPVPDEYPPGVCGLCQTAGEAMFQAFRKVLLFRSFFGIGVPLAGSRTRTIVTCLSKANTNIKTQGNSKAFGSFRIAVIAAASPSFPHFAAKAAKNLPRIFGSPKDSAPIASSHFRRLADHPGRVV
jgi:hypothetical protein